MLIVIAGLLLIALAMFAVYLQRVFSAVPAREIKRLSSRGEQTAKTLYRAVAFGAGLRVLLWTISILGYSFGYWLLVTNLQQWIALLILAVSLGAGMVLLPTIKLTKFGINIAIRLSPVLEWILRFINTPLQKFAYFTDKYRGLNVHSRLYEKADLIELLSRQQEQPDNRIDAAELHFLTEAMNFKDSHVVDLVMQNSMSKMVSTGDSIGPVLLDELFKSKQQYFAVYRGKKENIVGILSMQDIASVKPEGHVSDFMQSKICYVHEDYDLVQAARAMLDSGQQSALVVNKFEDIIGIVSLYSLIDRLFEADTITDDAVISTDKTSVAGYANKSEQTVAVEEQADEPSSSIGDPEVVE